MVDAVATRDMELLSDDSTQELVEPTETATSMLGRFPRKLALLFAAVGLVLVFVLTQRKHIFGGVAPSSTSEIDAKTELFDLPICVAGVTEGRKCTSTGCTTDSFCVSSKCFCPSNPGCFPGDATVQVQGRGEVKMSSLREGEHVLVRKSANSVAFEPVIGFLHSIPANGQADSVLAVVHSRGQVRLSPNHLLFVRDGDSHEDKLASDVTEGDELLFVDTVETAVPEFSRVLSIREEIGTLGMYAPLTYSGNIVVDGVVASNYASYSSSAWVPHGLFHVLFAPLRAFHALGLGGKASRSDVEDMHPYVEWLAAVHHQVRRSGVSVVFG